MATPKPNKPNMVVDDQEALRNKTLWTAADLAKLPRARWVIPNLFPRRGVVMISGPKSSLKSYILLAAGLSTVYGCVWHGTKLSPGMFVYVTGEDEEIVGDRRIAWLRAHNLPEAAQDGFRVVHVKHDSYRRASGKDKGRPEKLNLLDKDTVEALIADWKAAAEAENTTVNIVAVDPLTSLLPKLDDPVCRILVRHLRMIAEALDCCVVIINHVHRRNKMISQGSHVLADSVNGDLVAERIDDHMTNGVRTGLRTILHVNRLKGGREDSTEWIGTPMFMDDADGKPYPTCAMDCVGLAEIVTLDSVAVNRAWIASKLPPGTMANLAAVLRLCSWGHGGNQYDDLRNAVPLDEWIVVQLPNGEFRRLTRHTVGKGERIECCAVTPPPTAEGDKPKPVNEPEVAAATKEKGKRGGTQPGAGKPLGTIRIGPMSREAFASALDKPLNDDDRPAAFFTAIRDMQNKGAQVTDEGEAVLAFVRTLGETERGMKVLLHLFTKNKTPRTVLRDAAARMKAAKKAKEGDA